MTHFLGIDVSTTGSKALLINEGGQVISSASFPHTLSTPKPLWSEQDPTEWWQATIYSIRTVLSQSAINPKDKQAIGLTGQMHGLVHGKQCLQRALKPSRLQGRQNLLSRTLRFIKTPIPCIRNSNLH